MVGCGERCHVSYVTGASNWYSDYSWARTVILIAGKGRGGGGGCFFFYLFCFFTFVPDPLSSLYLSFISSTVSSISFLPFSGRRHKMTQRVDVSLNPSTIKTKEITFLIWLPACLYIQGPISKVSKSYFWQLCPLKVYRFPSTVLLHKQRGEASLHSRSRRTSRTMRQCFRGMMRAANVQTALFIVCAFVADLYIYY